MAWLNLTALTFVFKSDDIIFQALNLLLSLTQSLSLVALHELSSTTTRGEYHQDKNRGEYNKYDDKINMNVLFFTILHIIIIFVLD